MLRHHPRQLQLKSVRLGTLALLGVVACHAPRKMTWLGGRQVKVGVWQSIPAAWLITIWAAKPGERWQSTARRAKGDFELCLETGLLPPPDYDIEDAVPTQPNCVTGAGAAVRSVEVPDGGNAVWLRLHPTGPGDPHLDLRLDPR